MHSLHVTVVTPLCATWMAAHPWVHESTTSVRVEPRAVRVRADSRVPSPAAHHRSLISSGYHFRFVQPGELAQVVQVVLD
jgi:hypothetical protein